MKKLMFVIIFALVGVIMYQGGCFNLSDPMAPIIEALEGSEE